MAKTIEEMRREHASRSTTTRPAKNYRATVGAGQECVLELEMLSEEYSDLNRQHDVEKSRPRKASERVEQPARMVEIRDRMAELLDTMSQYEGNLTVTATKSDGDWTQWRLENPARTGDEPGARDDLMAGGGVCNIDSLVSELAIYVTAWEGNPLQPGDLEVLDLLLPDKKAIAAMVVSMYEVGDDLPKLRSSLSALLMKEQSSN